MSVLIVLSIVNHRKEKPMDAKPALDQPRIVSFRLPESEYLMLRRVAEREDRPASSVIRRALKQAMNIDLPDARNE